jgi:chemotaxis methyl-accepting protein methylase
MRASCLKAISTIFLRCRLAPILRQLGLKSIDDLCTLMQSSRQPEVGHQVVEAMTTNETYFFRDPSHYDAIRTVLLPRMIKEERGDTKKLRFWSAASSTGQEAYSLAMLLIEEGLRDWNIQNSGYRLFLAGCGTRPIRRVPADRGEPRPAGGPPDQAFSPFRHRSGN